MAKTIKFKPRFIPVEPFKEGVEFVNGGILVKRLVKIVKETEKPHK